MITLNEIRQAVIDWIEDDSNTDLIDRTINSQLRFICKANEFESLYRTADETPTAGGIFNAPPVCGRVTGLYPQVAWGELPAFSFMGRSVRPRANEPRTNRHLYHASESTRTAGATGYVLGGTQGGYTLTEVSGTAITADMAGKELKLAGDATRYLIVSAIADTSIEIFPALRLFDSQLLAGTVDPVGRKRYQLTDPSGNVYAEDVTVDFQIDHPPLTLVDDELMIPMERTLALLSVQQFLHSSKYDVDAERLQNAVFEAQITEYGTEPTNRQDNAPKDTMFAFRSKQGGRGRASSRR